MSIPPLLHALFSPGSFAFGPAQLPLARLSQVDKVFLPPCPPSSAGLSRLCSLWTESSPPYWTRPHGRSPFFDSGLVDFRAAFFFYEPPIPCSRCDLFLSPIQRPRPHLVFRPDCLCSFAFIQSLHSRSARRTVLCLLAERLPL